LDELAVEGKKLLEKAPGDQQKKLDVIPHSCARRKGPF
jgi:hypothetical protein